MKVCCRFVDTIAVAVLLFGVVRFTVKLYLMLGSIIIKGSFKP